MEKVNKIINRFVGKMGEEDYLCPLKIRISTDCTFDYLRDIDSPTKNTYSICTTFAVYTFYKQKYDISKINS